MCFIYIKQIVRLLTERAQSDHVLVVIHDIEWGPRHIAAWSVGVY